MNKKIFNKYFYFMIFWIINILSAYIYDIYWKNDTYLNILYSTSIALWVPMLLYWFNYLFLLLNKKLYLITIILVFSIVLIMIFINMSILKEWNDLALLFIMPFIAIILAAIRYLKEWTKLDEILKKEIEVCNKIYK